jgi:regulator of sigma E protease
MVGQVLLGLSILVILHEFGHFIAARAFGIKVEKFYLFFDAWAVSLFKFNYKGVEYGIGWLPLGGYVKIAGMIDESMDTEQMAGPPQPWEFRSKPAWQRLIVMLAGVTVNIILGVFIFWILTLRYGETYIPIEKLKYGVAPGKVGVAMGLKAGDNIIAVNGKPVKHFEDLMSSKVLLGGSNLTIIRNNHEQHILVPNTIYNELSDYGLSEFISPRVKFRVDSVLPNTGAAKAKLAKGDSIIAINGHQISFFDQLSSQLQQNKGKQVTLEIKRNNDTSTVNAAVSSEGLLGFARDKDTDLTRTDHFGFFSALPIGADRAWTTFSDEAKGIGKVAKGQVKATKAFAGPVGIAHMFGGTLDWIRFWSLVGLLSMALAFMNLLPIPALDGGHSMFLIIEMIKGKPLSDKFLERAQIVGFVILITLMVFIYGNDIIRNTIGK